MPNIDFRMEIHERPVGSNERVRIATDGVGYATKTVELPFVPQVGAEISDSGLRGERRIGAVTIDTAGKFVTVWIEPLVLGEGRDDPGAQLTALQEYGWTLVGLALQRRA